MKKVQWITFWSVGLVFIIGWNLLLIERDRTIFELPQEVIANGAQ